MRLMESRLSYDGLFFLFFDKKTTCVVKIWSIQCILRSIHDSASIFFGKSCIVDSDKGESQNKHTKEGGIKKKKC